MKDKNFNFLIITNGDNGGGIERFVYNLLHFFHQKEFINCELQLLRSVGGVYYEEYLKYADSLYSPVINERDGFLSRIKKYIRLFTQTKPECILSFSYWEATEQCIAAKISGTPIVIGYRSTTPTRKWTSFFRSIPINLFAHACIANSSSVASYMEQSLFIKKQKVYNYLNGIALSKYPFKDFSNIKEKKIFNILTVARLEPVKNHQIIIELAKKAKYAKLNWCFLWAGEGSLEQVYREKIRKYSLEGYIKFLGFINSTDGLYLDSDVFLLTSHNEGLSQALLEACASGLAVVVSDVPGMKDVVKEGENGFLIEKENLNGFFEVLKQLEEDSILREKLGNNARRTVEKNFSVEVIANRYFKLLQSCAK